MPAPAFDALPVNCSDDILHYLDPITSVVGIDEAQFFDPGIVEVAQQLAAQKIRVIVAGLDTDFRGEPFGCMPTFLAIAERVDKLQAICMICGESASRTQRLVNGKPANYDDPVVIVGASEMYEARCRQHHEVPRGKDARRSSGVADVSRLLFDGPIGRDRRARCGIIGIF
jgi:thymidine kinase